LASVEKYLEASDWAAWIPTLFEPRQFLTLTSRDFVYGDAMLHRYGYLVRKCNKFLYGNHWQRREKGISWVMGIEPQHRGVLHIHAVWDSPELPYSEIHKLWNRISGGAKIEPVSSHCGVADYVSKYAVKGGMVSTYLPRYKTALLAV
jgi:hypothetical protein